MAEGRGSALYQPPVITSHQVIITGSKNSLKLQRLLSIVMAKPNDNDFFYDVFLSFRGRSSFWFTYDLYKALRQKGIYTFRDRNELRIGAEIRPSLIKAIENSRMWIVVLCEDYASSTWCLDELAHIIHCYHAKKGKQLLLIFYRVKPSDVWDQENSYAEAMIEHGKRFGKDSEKVKIWSEALSQTQHLTAEHCLDDWSEPGLIKKIVDDTCAKLPAIPLPIKHTIGMDSRFQEVKPIIDIESHDTVCILEIYGAGGIGKTTFALDLYNNFRNNFEAASFLANVREKSNKTTKGLEDLQKILLSEMGEKTELMMGNTFNGANEIKLRLCRKKVLLVLDDVDCMKQLESLAGGGDWFGSGSRIIITTRDSTLLDQHAINDVIIQKYEMKELNDRDSLELFCWHAFKKSAPEKDFEDVSNRAVLYAKGLPLALKVIGSNLEGGSLEDWEMELNKYETTLSAEIQEVLEISYHSLSDMEKKIFLDISCFFKGEKWEYVERILKASDFFSSIRVFIVKCLITIDENGCLDMHDLIQDMGRGIVRKESLSNFGDRSRLWFHEEVLQVLRENTGSDRIEGIVLDPPNHVDVCERIDTAFEMMRNLRILIIRNTTFSTAPSYLPNNLRLLDWKGYPSKSFPPDFYPHRIVDFKLPHSFLMLENPFQKFEDLTFINLSDCQFLTRIPNVSGAINLKVLTLDRCHKLEGFDKSIGVMPKLVYLSASRCNKLKSFVCSMYLPYLEVLSFNFCTRFGRLPYVKQNMDKPLKIYLVNTAIKEFPKSISNLTGLEYLDISSCTRLKNLPSNLLLLPKLVTLLVDGCSQIGESFISFNEMHSITTCCPNLTTLHLTETNLSNKELCAILKGYPKLEALKVSYNDLVSLPECIKGSMHLKSLDVSYCKNLRSIPELPPAIQKVNARYCRGLTSKASKLLWSKVHQEKERIQFVIPETNIPKWFHCTSEEGIPLMWARNKFPTIALAFVVGEDKKSVMKKFPFPPPELGLPQVQVELSHTVGVQLFVDGQEICRKESHYCSIGEDHVLLCDLHVLFSDEEWQGLDAHVIGDEWRAIQVQYRSFLPLKQWGVFVYKQKTNMDDIQFRNSNMNIPIPSSALAPKEQFEQMYRHFYANFNPRELLGQYYLSLVDKSHSFTKFLLRSIRHTITDAKGKVSACDYGASLEQYQEESTWDVVRFIDIIKEGTPKHVLDTYPDDAMQHEYRVMEETLRARAEFMREEGQDSFVHDMPIILEDDDENPSSSGRRCRRYWGRLHIKHGEPGFNAVSRVVWRSSVSSNISPLDTTCIVLLKASTTEQGEELEEHGYDPALEELMSRIADDAMSLRLNKSNGKLTASIVMHNKGEFVSFRYLAEAAFLGGKELWDEGKWTCATIKLVWSMLLMFRFIPCGLLGTNFKITSYGKLRIEHDAGRTPNWLDRLIMSDLSFIWKGMRIFLQLYLSIKLFKMCLIELIHIMKDVM
ncbi:hypothetical protein Fmac_025542 [Flemingia macrophylla]|uniref:TIR domain-containing protein n=1 Tax=Flemingia macrophylla TaxID=520843 RepID=A0ABD1LSJ2_9FABA